MADDDPLRLDRQLCFAAVRAARHIVGLYRPVLEPLGLTHPQYLVMLCLWERDGRTVTGIAEAISLEPATVSPLLRRLEAQGLVTRSRRASDERVVEVLLTDEGRALREQALAVPGEVMAAAGLEVSDVTTLRAALHPFLGG